MTPRESPSLALDEAQGGAPHVALGAQAVVLRGFARNRASELIAAIAEIAAVSPFRRMVTPGGWEMVGRPNHLWSGWLGHRPQRLSV
jgi:DNA oxidative demethylase